MKKNSFSQHIMTSSKARGGYYTFQISNDIANLQRELESFSHYQRLGDETLPDNNPIGLSFFTLNQKIIIQRSKYIGIERHASQKRPGNYIAHNLTPSENTQIDLAQLFKSDIWLNNIEHLDLEKVGYSTNPIEYKQDLRNLAFYESFRDTYEYFNPKHHQNRVNALCYLIDNIILAGDRLSMDNSIRIFIVDEPLNLKHWFNMLLLVFPVTSLNNYFTFTSWYHTSLLKVCKIIGLPQEMATVIADLKSREQVKVVEINETRSYQTRYSDFAEYINESLCVGTSTKLFKLYSYLQEINFTKIYPGLNRTIGFIKDKSKLSDIDKNSIAGKNELVNFYEKYKDGNDLEDAAIRELIKADKEGLSFIKPLIEVKIKNSPKAKTTTLNNFEKLIVEASNGDIDISKFWAISYLALYDGNIKNIEAISNRIILKPETVKAFNEVEKTILGDCKASLFDYLINHSFEENLKKTISILKKNISDMQIIRDIEEVESDFDSYKLLSSDDLANEDRITILDSLTNQGYLETINSKFNGTIELDWHQIENNIKVLTKLTSKGVSNRVLPVDDIRLADLIISDSNMDMNLVRVETENKQKTLAIRNWLYPKNEGWAQKYYMRVGVVHIDKISDWDQLIKGRPIASIEEGLKSLKKIKKDSLLLREIIERAIRRYERSSKLDSDREIVTVYINQIPPNGYLDIEFNDFIYEISKKISPNSLAYKSLSSIRKLLDNSFVGNDFIANHKFEYGHINLIYMLIAARGLNSNEWQSVLSKINSNNRDVRDEIVEGLKWLRKSSNNSDLYMSCIVGLIGYCIGKNDIDLIEYLCSKIARLEGDIVRFRNKFSGNMAKNQASQFIYNDLGQSIFKNLIPNFFKQSPKKRK
jgi:hypothetical protein